MAGFQDEWRERRAISWLRADLAQQLKATPLFGRIQNKDSFLFFSLIYSITPVVESSGNVTTAICETAPRSVGRFF